MLCLPLLLGFWMSSREAPVHIYVSPRGDDSSAGSQALPVATVERALTLAREGRSGAEGPATIELAPGTYRLKRGLLLHLDDANLTLKASKQGTARLFGGRLVASWHAPDESAKSRLKTVASDHVLRADLPSDFDPGTLERRGFGLPRRNAGVELFFGGKPMPLASFPNLGEWVRTAEPASKSGFGYTGDRPKTWKPSKDIWTLGYWNFDWAESYERITSLDTEKRVIDLSPEKPPYEIKAGRRFRFVNVFEELDSPGEWYFDRSDNALYFWPPSGVKASEAFVSESHEPLIQVTDTHDVQIQGIVIEGGRSGGIDVQRSSHVVISGCLIRNLGTFGVEFRGCLDSGIRGCDLTGMGESAIMLDGGDRRTLTPGRLFAEDNRIWAYSRWTRTYQPGVSINGVGNRISHNQIYDAPHNAILLSGNDHVIEYNDIRRVCTETGDAGAVYMGRDPTMRGAVIRFNRFEDLGPTVKTEGNFTEVMSVYLDDCWPGTTIHGNLFLAQGTGIMIGGGQDNTVTNNIFVGNHPAVHVDARGKGWAKNMFAPGDEWNFIGKVHALNADHPPYSTHYPALANYLNDDPAFPKRVKVIRNVCVGGDWLRLQDGLKESDLVYSSNVVDKLGSTLADALKKVPPGFEKISVDKIGLTTRTGRVRWQPDGP